jgi:phospholipid/cholesterol/gamma-HCH transport system substrate-binding protein
MDEWLIRFRVGAVVVAATVITVILVMLFGSWPSTFRSQYTVHVHFAEAPGITVDTPVRKSGVRIGRVSEVTLLEDGGVRVSAKINGQYSLRRKEICRIGSGSLMLGDAVIEFVPGDQQDLLKRFDKNGNGRLDLDELQAADEYITDTEVISDGKVYSNPLRVLVNLEGSIRAAFDSIDSAGREVEKLAHSVNLTVGGDNQVQRILQKAESAMDHFDGSMQAIQNVLGDRDFSQKLGKSLEEFPALLKESRDTLQSAREAFAKIQSASEKAEANLDNLEQFTKPLRERGPQLVQKIENSATNLNNLLEQLTAFSESLNSGRGTLGRLVHDDDIYQQIQRVVNNAEEVSKRLRPIMEDVRTFTDKIARDPGQLGLRGALDKRPAGLKTGLNWTP